MLIHLKDWSILNWLWHDAELYTIKAKWLDNGSAVVYLRSKINPEEDRQPLFDLGITSQVVDVQFRNTWWLRSDLVGYNADREVLVDWDTIEPSPLTEELQDRGLAKNADLIHPRIRCSGGSTFDVVFSDIWLETVQTEE